MDPEVTVDGFVESLIDICIPPYAGITRTGSTVDDPGRPLSSLVRTPVV